MYVLECFKILVMQNRSVIRPSLNKMQVLNCKYQFSHLLRIFKSPTVSSLLSFRDNFPAPH